jgi:hypothetical protein
VGAARAFDADVASKPFVMDSRPRVACWVFVAVEIFAAVVWLRAGRQQWFFLDEWDFLATREATNLDDVFRPHFEHWTSLPVLEYRVLWEIFGLRSYLPYQVILLAAHLGSAALLRVVMRRALVAPWIATLGASAVALFGTGNENVVWAFQITFTGALMLGLVHLVLADHEGPLDRRDVYGLVAGLGSIMCAAPGLVMVGTVGLAALFRRGWQAALFHTAPLGLIYLVWTLFYGESSQFSSKQASASAVLEFVVRGLQATFLGLAQVDLVGWIVAIAMVTGIGWLAVNRGRDALRRRAAPLALALGAICFLTFTAVGRVGEYGAGRAVESRYLYMAAAMLVPAICVALDALARRWRLLTPIAVLLLLVGLPGNVAAMDDRSPYLAGDRGLVLALPSAPVAREVPRDLAPSAAFLRDVTIGWLLDGRASGRIPEPESISPALEGRVALTILLNQATPASAVQPSSCRVLDSPQRRVLERGQALTFDGMLSVSEQPDGRSNGVVFNPSFGRALIASVDTPALWFAPSDVRRPVELCG